MVYFEVTTSGVF